MSTFFTADLHFGHENVIKYAKRPFANAAEMDYALFENWCRVVTKHDTVYVLGDVALCHPDRAIALVRDLPGQKHLIFGNHDKRLRKNGDFLDLFHSPFRDFAEIKVPDAALESGHQNITLCHYALRVWNKSHYGAWNLYGHSHGSLADDPNALSLDVGVDCWNYTPVSYEMLKAKMAEKTWKPIDHHGRER
jgi:calcineurin-like phosphoesterase family protein